MLIILKIYILFSHIYFSSLCTILVQLLSRRLYNIIKFSLLALEWDLRIQHNNNIVLENRSRLAITKDDKMALASKSAMKCATRAASVARVIRAKSLAMQFSRTWPTDVVVALAPFSFAVWCAGILPLLLLLLPPWRISPSLFSLYQLWRRSGKSFWSRVVVL